MFAAASLACAHAPSVAVLIVARCVQALGGAAVIAGAIDLIARGRGSHQLAAPMQELDEHFRLAARPALRLKAIELQAHSVPTCSHPGPPIASRPIPILSFDPPPAERAR
jgi:hypothetical protein